MDRRVTDNNNRESLPPQASIPDVTQILNIFLKKRLLITVLIFLPIAVGGVYLKTKPSVYQATASVLIENQQFNLANFQDVLGDIKFDNLTVPTQVQVISSPNLVQETIISLGVTMDDKDNILLDDSLKMKGQPENIGYPLTKAFLENLLVKQQGQSRVIEIGFQSHSPQIATMIANAHAKQYVYSQIQIKRQQAEQLNKWISEQIVQLKEESLKKSMAVQKFRADNGMVLGRNSQELVYQQISDIAAQLTPIETRELDLKARMEMLSGKSGSTITEVVDSELIQNLKSQSSAAAQKLQSLRSDMGENHPEVIALRKEVAQIEGDIGRETKNIKKSIENELNTISKQKEMLEAKLSELQKQADVSQENQITLQALQVEESASSKLLDSFLARSEEIKSQIDFTRPDVRIVSFADIPDKPAGSKKMILMLLVCVFSVIFALGTALLLELIDDGIRKKDDVRKLLNLKLLGCLPKEKDPIKSVLLKNRTLYTEEIKRLYIHISAQPTMKTIVFSSAAHDEGKSTVAVSLAYYLASIGKKTIIIDADTLSPTLSGITMVSQKPGFYELLSGTNALNDVIRQDKGGLYVIPCGEKSSFVSDLVLAGKFDNYLAALKLSFDYILIDTAPVLLASDAEAFSKLADQVIIVTHWAKTPVKSLRKAASVLGQFCKTPPYVILNRMNVDDLKEK